MQLTDRSRPDLRRGEACVLVAARSADAHARACLRSVLECTPRTVVVAITADAAVRRELEQMLDETGATVWAWEPTDGYDPRHATGDPAPRETGTDVGAPPHDDPLTRAVDCALALLAPADVVLINSPCLVAAGWLERLGEAARADTNTATASALSDSGGPLGLQDRPDPGADIGALAERVAAHAMRLRPSLGRAVGPCIYLRRDALELAGPLDTTLGLAPAVEIDLAHRCLASGLGHVAADDVLVQALDRADGAAAVPETGAGTTDSQTPDAAAAGVLARALNAARRPRSELAVTLDARALEGTTTGTQRHIMELIRALAATDALRLRLLVSPATDAATLEALRSLPRAELLAADEIGPETPQSPLFHRPQQIFSTADLRFAMRLGERIVINQLDLIAYRNPAYHPDAAAWHSHRRVTRQALAAAERVVVFSEHTRGDVLSDELADDARLCTIAPGLDHLAGGSERRPAELASTLGDAGATPAGGRRFLLCLGTDFRHKNRVFALRLFDSLRERFGWEGELVFAGTHIPHGSSRELEQQLLRDRPRLAADLTELGAVEEEEKNWLMGHAAAILYPSVYEGFGLVPFEAALAGVPCVFAARSSLAEVLPAEAAAIVPWDAQQSAERVHALLTDPAARERHVRALADAASELTWRRCAEALLEVYEQALVAPVVQAHALSRDEVEREHELRELLAAHDALVQQLATERDHAKRMYDELNAAVGSGLSLIGPEGSLPQEMQRSLLALSARPAISRPLYALWARAFVLARVLARRARGLAGASRGG